jgi:DNA-binding Lrp family transcriptional regulator
MNMVVAYSLIKTELGKDYRVLAMVKRHREVKEVALTYGAFDLIAKIEVPSPEELDAYVFNVLRKIPEIRDTMTLVTSRIEPGGSE